MSVIPCEITEAHDMLRSGFHWPLTREELYWKIKTLTGEEYDMLMLNGVEIRQILRKDISL